MAGILLRLSRGAVTAGVDGPAVAERLARTIERGLHRDRLRTSKTHALDSSIEESEIDADVLDLAPAHLSKGDRLGRR